MKEKTAYVSLTFLFSYTPEELFLPDDCSEEEMIDAAAAIVHGEILPNIDYLVNDIEISVN